MMEWWIVPVALTLGFWSGWSIGKKPFVTRAVRGCITREWKTPAAIKDELEADGLSVSIGTVYVELEKLEHRCGKALECMRYEDYFGQRKAYRWQQ